MKRRMHPLSPPFYMLSILVLLFIAVLCMPSHVQAAAADADKNPTIAADGYEIVGTPTNPAGPSMYAHVRQEAFEGGWFEIRETVGITGIAGWNDSNKRAQAQMALASVVDASTGYSTVAWADARAAQHYGSDEPIRIRVKFTKPVIIHEDTKLRITINGFAYMDIDTMVHDDPLVNPRTDLPDQGRDGQGTVFHWSVDENGDVSTTATDNLYVTFVYTVQDGNFTTEGIRMPAWDDPFYAPDGSGGYDRVGNLPTGGTDQRYIIPTDDGWSNYRAPKHGRIRGNIVAGKADTGTAPGGAYEGAFVWPIDVTDPGQRPFTYLGESLPYRRLTDGGTNVYLYSVDTFSADTVVAQIVDGIGARHDPLDPAHPTIGDTVAEQTGAFDIEIKFANYVSGSRYAEQPQSDTFGADKILIDDAPNPSGWTITDADFYAVDAVSTAADNVIDVFAGELKHVPSYVVYRATITPPANFNGDVAISIAEGAITDLAGNTSKASADALTVPVNTPAPAEVTIPDATLLAKIKETLNISAGTAVTPANMLELTSLDLSGSDVSKLTGLEHATNLEELDLSNTEVSDISALSSLTSLVELSLSGTPVEDISALSNLTNLKVLDLSDTQVSDISPLSQ